MVSDAASPAAWFRTPHVDHFPQRGAEISRSQGDGPARSQAFDL